MNYGVLLCILLSHAAADFILQSDSIANMRNNYNMKIFLRGNFFHFLIVLITMYICTLYYLYNYFSFYLIRCIFYIAILHFFIDLNKSFLISTRPVLKYNIFCFIFDQIVHIIVIYIFSILISINLSGYKFSINLFKSILFSNIKVKDINLTYNEKLVFSAFLFIVAVWGVGIFINLFSKELKNKKFISTISKGDKIEDNFLCNTGALKGGYLIGILERIFIIIAIVLLKPEFIGFVLTTKSIARFKKFDDDSFVEYFIIGTFISFICAILLGVAIKNLNIY